MSEAEASAELFAGSSLNAVGGNTPSLGVNNDVTLQEVTTYQGLFYKIDAK